jgi:16S rRNA (uracil1498-N3)-methyltransferase
VIVAASEQCGRNRLARLAPLQDFGRYIAQPADGPRILLSPRATQSLAGLGARQPAAGGDPADRAGRRLQRAGRGSGARTWRAGAGMGPRVLRTETAGLAALATLNAVWAPTDS